MQNSFVFIGHISSVEPENKRIFIEEIGEGHTGVLPIILADGVASNAGPYLKKGALMGIKGYMKYDGISVRLIATKMSFLSSGNPTE